MSTIAISKINSLVLEYVKEPKIAQKMIEALGSLVSENEKSIQEGIKEKTLENKIIIKEELKNELVTRELFEEKTNSLRTEMNERFNLVDERFKRMELWFKILIAVMIFGFFVFNPNFIELIKIIFS